jgi:hypothetical protein
VIDVDDGDNGDDDGDGDGDNTGNKDRGAPPLAQRDEPTAIIRVCCRRCDKHRCSTHEANNPGKVVKKTPASPTIVVYTSLFDPITDMSLNLEDGLFLLRVLLSIPTPPTHFFFPFISSSSHVYFFFLP